MTDEEWDIIQRVHLRGAYKVTKAAFPHMKENGYGRIVMTCSTSGIYGNFGQTNYAAAKMALFGFANALAIEGAKYNVFTNTIAPNAGSRMTETIMPAEVVQALKPDYVAPIVLYLSHDSCQENVSLFEVGGGYCAKLRWERAAGALFPLNQKITPEMFQKDWDKVTDFKNSTHPANQRESSMVVMSNLSTATDSSTDSAPPASSASSNSTVFSQLKSGSLFEQIQSGLKENADLSKKLNATIKWRITDAKDKNKILATVVLYLKETPGKVTAVAADDKDSKADVTLTVSDEDLVGIASGKLNAQQMFFQKKLQITGNIMLSQKLEVLFNSVKPKAKL
jgi:putative sterol carrier protein